MIDIYNQPAKTVTVLCHTSLGDPSDKQGRFFVKGNEYKLITEVKRRLVDTKQPRMYSMILVINQYTLRNTLLP